MSLIELMSYEKWLSHSRGKLDATVLDGSFPDFRPWISMSHLRVFFVMDILTKSGCVHFVVGNRKCRPCSRWIYIVSKRCWVKFMLCSANVVLKYKKRTCEKGLRFSTYMPSCTLFAQTLAHVVVAIGIFPLPVMVTTRILTFWLSEITTWTFPLKNREGNIPKYTLLCFGMLILLTGQLFFFGRTLCFISQ